VQLSVEEQIDKFDSARVLGGQVKRALPFMISIPPAVRILPMDSKQEPGFAGCSAREIQHQFFLVELARRAGTPGKYCYRKVGLRAEPGTVVLFQYAGRIIASAVLAEVERFKKTELDDVRGALYFDVKTIKVFDPVDAAFIRKFWPEVTRLGQAKWSLDPESFGEFERRLTGVEVPEL
jgi:hypothetical protein